MDELGLRACSIFGREIKSITKGTWFPGAFTVHNGDLTPGYGDPKIAREYERKIRNLLQYKNTQTMTMARRLLDDARHDHKISTRQLRRLEGLFGGEKGPGKSEP